MYIKAFLVNIETKNLFFKKFDKEFILDPTLLTGFLSGISIFARDLSDDQLKEIIMGKNKIYYHLIDKESEFSIILVCNKNTKEIEIKKLLRKFEVAFFKLYSIDEMKAHATDPEYFYPFDKIAENIVNKISQSEIDDSIKDTELITDTEIMEELDFEVKKETLQVLFKVKKNLPGVIRSLFLNKQVVVTGQRPLVKIFIDALQIFTPNRQIKKVYWSENFIETDTDADIIGVPFKLANLFFSSTIINLDTKKVFGISKLKDDKYFVNIVKKLKKLNPEEVIHYIKGKFDYLERISKELFSMVTKDEVSDEEINQFIKKIDEDLLETLETHLELKKPRDSKIINEMCEKIRLQMAKRILL
jgi:hypothetical protein